MSMNPKPMSGDLKSLYVVTGDESLLVERAVAQVVEAALERCGPPQLNHTAFRASEPNAGEAFSAARTLPMMASLRLVVLRELDQASDALMEVLVEYARAPVDTSVVVVTGPGTPKTRKGGKNWGVRLRNALKGSEHAHWIKCASSEVRPARFVVEQAASAGHRLSLTHANLLTNIRAMGAVLEVGPEDVFVSWLPLYHDMGLIGGLLFPMIANLVLALMSPIRFIMDPLTWLQAMHDHEGTMSPAPNFGYELVTRRSRRRDDELERLDLSRWRVALTGAEHVRPESMARFTARFGRCGFRRAAFLPVYGLAESSLAVSFSDPHRAARAVTISRRAVLRDGVARRHYPSSPPEDAWRVVSVGQPVWSSDVRIVTARGDRVRMGWVGQIQVRGPSVTSGYYNDPESTAAILNDGWLTTGDLGFQLVLPGDRHPSLFIVDRLKGLIVKRGRNLYAADIEQLVWEVPGIKAGVAAFGVLGEGRRGAEEMLIVVAEVAEPNNPDECARVEREVQESVSTSTGILIDQLVQVPRRTLPRTTSGKIQRIVAKTRWADGEYR